jgi:hypothetical protein
MANKPRDQSQSKNESEKQQSETVVLSAEELRAISGGVSVVKPPPQPTDSLKLQK